MRASTKEVKLFAANYPEMIKKFENDIASDKHLELIMLQACRIINGLYRAHIRAYSRTARAIVKRLVKHFWSVFNGKYDLDLTDLSFIRFTNERKELYELLIIYVDKERRLHNEVNN